MSVKVYVAGPMYSSGRMDENIRQALEAATTLRERGFLVFVPHLYFFWNYIIPKEKEFWLSLDKDWLNECDCMLVLPGYSEGVQEELDFANANMIQIFTDINKLISAYTSHLT